MPLLPRPAVDLHAGVARMLALWKRDPSFGQAVLAYGVRGRGVHFAEIRRDKSDPYALPLPPRVPAPYRDWLDFFRRYLEPEVRILAAAAGVPVYVLNARGALRPLTQGAAPADRD